MDRRSQADHQQILNRLRARAEQIDRQLDAALKIAGLTRQTFERVPQLVKPADPRRFQEVLRTIEARLTEEGGVTWEELQRPSLSQLTGAFGGRLIRV